MTKATIESIEKLNYFQNDNAAHRYYTDTQIENNIEKLEKKLDNKIEKLISQGKEDEAFEIYDAIWGGCSNREEFEENYC